MELSFIKWEDLKSFFISSNAEDLILANNILEEKRLDTRKLDELIDDLNLSYRDWHFFMENCRIKRVKAQPYLRAPLPTFRRVSPN